MAAGLLVAAGAGAWAAQVPGLAIPVVATVAAVATWICRAWETGPPGPYPFTLVCAVGTTVGAQRDPWHLVALVAGGFASLTMLTAVPYDLTASQGRILMAGLPERLAIRLREGR